MGALTLDADTIAVLLAYRNHDAVQRGIPRNKLPAKTYPGDLDVEILRVLCTTGKPDTYALYPSDAGDRNEVTVPIVTFTAFNFAEDRAAIEATGLNVVRVVDENGDVLWPTGEIDPLVAAVRDMEPETDQFGYEPGHPGSPYRTDPPDRKPVDALGTFMDWKKFERIYRAPIYVLTPATPGRPEKLRIVERAGFWTVQVFDNFDGWNTWVSDSMTGPEVTIRERTPEDAAQALDDLWNAMG